MIDLVDLDLTPKVLEKLYLAYLTYVKNKFLCHVCSIDM